MRLPGRHTLHSLLQADLMAFTHRSFQEVVPGQRFLPNWHIEAITHQLERIRNGENRRLIITIPPRNLKSICASVAFPAFVLGHDPSARILCASYAQDLASKHARDCRKVIESAWYQQVFPRTRLDRRKNTEAEFETTARGYRMSTSVGGTLTGRGGNLLIIDDPMKPSEAMSEVQRAAVAEWYDLTLSSRLDSKTDGAIVIIMQRLHLYDLVGHVLAKGTPWVRLDLPAVALEDQTVPLSATTVHRRPAGDVLHSEREPLAALEELEATMGSHAFSAQYQQQPVPVDGALVKRRWLRTYREPPRRSMGDKIVQSWDTASRAEKTSNYSACTTWLKRRDEYFLLHVLRVRLEYPDLRRRVQSHATEFGATTVLIEDASSGTALIQDFRRDGGIRPTPIKPEGEKIVRLEAQCAAIEAGQVLVPESASWLADFLDELLAFPGGRYDDQVDSFSQFLKWAREWRPIVHA